MAGCLPGADRFPLSSLAGDVIFTASAYEGEPDAVTSTFTLKIRNGHSEVSYKDSLQMEQRPGPGQS